MFVVKHYLNPPLYSENEFVASEQDADFTDHDVDKETDPLDSVLAGPLMAREGIDHDGTLLMFVVKHYLNPPTYTEHEFDYSEHDDDFTDHSDVEASNPQVCAHDGLAGMPYEGDATNPLDIVYDVLAGIPMATREGIDFKWAMQECCRAGRLPMQVVLEAVKTWTVLGVVQVCHHKLKLVNNEHGV